MAAHGLEAGSSIHLNLLGPDDFSAALLMRRRVNHAAAHRNRQRQGRYERLLAEHEAKLEAWHARAGCRGRKPVAPQRPKKEPEEAKPGAAPVIKEATENAFRTAQSFVFDRAFTDGLFPPGPNPWRQWNPSGNGGRKAVRTSPCRSVQHPVVATRLFPAYGFMVDLGDVLAGRAAEVGDGCRTGERYRTLGLTATQLALRPGEIRFMRDWCVKTAEAEALVLAEDGHHLKNRPVGVTRRLPLAQLVGALQDEHRAARLGATVGGYAFASPLSLPLDTSNSLEDLLRPALAELCDRKTGSWPEFSHLIGTDLRLFRKAGVSTWFHYGVDTRQSALWAGHNEIELPAPTAA